MILKSAVAFAAIFFFTSASEFKPSLASQTPMQILSNQQDVIYKFQVTTLKGHTDLVTSVKFSPDGKTVATATLGLVSLTALPPISVPKKRVTPFSVTLRLRMEIVPFAFKVSSARRQILHFLH